MRKRYSELYEKINANHLSIEHDYDNPDDYYNLIHMPTRKKEFVSLCWEKVDDGIKANPDTGGFLCAIGYNDQRSNLNKKKYRLLVEEYLDLAEKSKNPHCIRWCISLCYLLGRIFREVKYHERCIAYDFTKFSPLILTKVLASCMELYTLTGNKKYLKQGIELYKRGLSCNFDEVFGHSGTYSRVAMTDFLGATQFFVEIGRKIAI